MNQLMSTFLHVLHTQLPWAVSVPVPRDIPVGLPVWPQVLDITVVIGVFIHAVLVGLTFGSLLLSVILECVGLRIKRYDRLAAYISRCVTVFKNLAIVSAIGPLLFIGAGYASQFYTANSLTGLAWLGLAPILCLGFVLAYTHRFTWEKWRGPQKARHIGVGVATILVLGFVPLIILSNVNLMLFPGKWVHVQGFFSALEIGNVFPTYAAFLMAALGLTGLYFAGLFLHLKIEESKELKDFSVKELVGLFYHLTLWSTVGLLVFGPLFVLTLPRIGLDAGVYTMFGLGLTLILISIYQLSQDLFAGQMSVRRHSLIVLLFLTAFIALGWGQQQYRNNSLRFHQKLIQTKSQEFRGLELATRMRLAAGMDAGDSLTDAPTGRSIFVQNCKACHAYDRVIAAPPITEIYDIYKGNPDGIVRWARNPGKKREEFAQMQSFAHLGDEKLRLVADFLLQVGSGEESLDEPAAQAVEVASDDGAALFQMHCTACHGIGEGKKIGPDLKDVTQRRERDWLVRMIQKPSEMLKEDPIAIELLEEYKVPMADLNLTDEEVEAIIKYLENPTVLPSAAAASTAAVSSAALRDSKPKFELVLTPEQKGKKLFIGTARLTRAGPSCISCHSIRDESIISGGNIGPDLTDVYSRLGSEGIAQFLREPVTPLKMDAYGKKSISDDEITDITAYLKDVNSRPISASPKNYSGIMLYSGWLGVFLWLGIYSCIWYKRRGEGKH